MPIVEGKLPGLKARKTSAIEINEFVGGNNVLLSETRLKKNEAKESTNLMLNEDGVWDKRWGSQQFGPTFDNDIDGFKEYRKADGTTELIVVEGGAVWRTTSSGKTQITGATLTAGYSCFFVQIKTYLYICNGEDPVTRYDGTNLTQYVAITTPANQALSRGAGLSTGSYTYYYRVTAVNAVGETIPAAEGEITVDKNRDIWAAANEYIDVDWDAVSGALKYVIYFSDTSGYEVKLSEVSTNTYQDLGTDVPNPYIEPPDDNTTGGPKLKTIAISGNRLWGTEPDNPYKVYFSGSGVDLGNFSPAYSGGWVGLETGGRNRVTSVVDFQGKAHAICESPEGKGAIWEINLESQTIADTTFTVPIPTKLIGAIGTNAPRSIILVENDIIFLNIKRVTIFGNEPGVLSVLRSNEISSKVRPYIQSLDGGSFKLNAAYYYDAKVFLSVATSSGDPDKIMIFDREKIAWAKPWTIGVTQFGEFTDSSTVRFLGSIGAKLFEFSPGFEGDDGVAFQQKYVSGRFPVGADWTKFGKIKDCAIKLRNVRGTVQYQISGTGKDENFVNLASGDITPGTSDTGIGWDAVGTFKVGTTSGIPTFFASESLIRYLVLNKLIRDIQFTVKTSGNSISDRFTLTGLRAEGFRISTGKPASWKLS